MTTTTISTCEAPRCEGIGTALVVAHDVAERFPGLAAADGAVRLVLCEACAGQVIDELRRGVAGAVRVYSFG